MDQWTELAKAAGTVMAAVTGAGALLWHVYLKRQVENYVTDALRPLKDWAAKLERHLQKLEGKMLGEQEIESMRRAVATSETNREHLTTDKARIDRFELDLAQYRSDQRTDHDVLLRLDERTEQILSLLKNGRNHA